MSSRRNGEQGLPPPYRTKRLYRANGYWYFESREGTQFGPFENLQEAKKALAFFIAQNVYNRAEEELTGEEHPGQQDEIEHLVQEVLDILRHHKDFGPLAADSWIRSRLKDLERNNVKGPLSHERADVLRYALDHADQLFDSELFMETVATR